MSICPILLLLIVLPHSPNPVAKQSRDVANHAVFPSQKIEFCVVLVHGKYENDVTFDHSRLFCDVWSPDA